MKKIIGYLAVILASISLSLQIYFLSFLQKFDYMDDGSAYLNISNYFYEYPINLSFLLTIGVIILGIILIIKEKKVS